MEKTLQHQTTTQRSGLPPTRSGNHRADGPKADHALTIKLDHSDGADHIYFAVTRNFRVFRLYNDSIGYALSIGLLSDLLSGRRSLPLTFLD
ncbi:lytic murein transglycosylase [Falsiruegeria mediterranea]|uniref:lytic murein transglycosylase n=1 Tax=Falsiruegeria mediterranea TaxID=1280832 RepID=UPI000D55D510